MNMAHLAVPRRSVCRYVVSISLLNSVGNVELTLALLYPPGRQRNFIVDAESNNEIWSLEFPDRYVNRVFYLMNIDSFIR